MPQDVTALLRDLRTDERAVDALFPVVYDELRRIAHRELAFERRGHTLVTTALVHEAYVRLVDQTRVVWQDRAHFCAVAARAMRRILVDHARRRQALKRGGKQQPLPLDGLRRPGGEAPLAVHEQATHLIALDGALTRLGELNERLAQVVELRFFGGMTEAETAEALGVSARTVRRDWVKAKAWLFKELYPEYQGAVPGVPRSCTRSTGVRCPVPACPPESHVRRSRVSARPVLLRVASAPLALYRCRDPRTVDPGRGPLRGGAGAAARRA